MCISNEKKIELYKTMLTIRLFEEKVAELYRQAMVPGFVHLYIGEEAVATGVCSVLRKSDYLTSTHRGHGHCIAKGARLDRLMAEICGKKTGYGEGRGGTMHIFIPEIGVLGTQGVVGDGIPLATGAALKAKLKKTKQVSVCFFGDGASNLGLFHESLNLASVWELPVIFVCENNLYATATSTSISMKIDNISTRGDGYGIPSAIADGMDVLDVYERADIAVQAAREGAGPALIECKTYRFCEHLEGDPIQNYRTREELARWKTKCAIKRMKNKLIDEDILNVDGLRDIENSVRAKIEEAATFASESSLPSKESALTHVYSG